MSIIIMTKMAEYQFTSMTIKRPPMADTTICRVLCMERSLCPIAGSRLPFLNWIE